MIKVSVNEQNELVITGKVEVGEKVHGRCCPGFDWEVTTIFVDKSYAHADIWGLCANPDCPNYQANIGPTDYYRGVSVVSGEDLAEWILDNPAALQT